MLGAAVAASPLPILVAVLMMAESQRLRGAVALALGWFVSIAVTAVFSIVAANAVPHHSVPTHRRLLAWGDVALGVIVGLLALRTRRRAQRDPQAGAPKWLNRVGTMPTLTAFGLGLFIPPTVIALAAGSEIAGAHVAARAAALGVALFAVIGSIGVCVPIAFAVAQPARSAARLARWQAWLEAHWQQVLVVLLAVVAVYLVLKGAVALR